MEYREKISNIKDIENINKVSTEEIKRALLFTKYLKIFLMVKSYYLTPLTPKASQLLIIMLYRYSYINTVNEGRNKRDLNSQNDNTSILLDTQYTTPEYIEALKELHHMDYIDIKKDKKTGVYYYYFKI